MVQTGYSVLSATSWMGLSQNDAKHHKSSPYFILSLQISICRAVCHKTFVGARIARTVHVGTA